ncbi:MAG TPA: cadherin-like beta sandwich domain-containing protein [Clostridiaceae bacterium]|nr:cadherin-like beta sandwich domain-containing protein [Clostridiaceae bacterium]
MNKIRVIKKVIISMIVLLIAITVKSMAADINVSSSKKNISNGESANITISSSYTGKVSISVSGGTSSSSSEWLEGSFFVTVKANSDNGVKVTVTPAGKMSDSSGNLKNVSGGSISIAGKSKPNGKDDSTNTKNNDKKSDNNDNKDNNDTTTEPTFKSANDKVYATGDINIRKSYSADSDKIGTLKAGESVTRTGISDNGWSKVSYNGGTGYIKTSLLTTEEPSKASDKALKTLEVTPEGLDPEFDPETTSYTLNVGADVEKLEIKAAPNDEKATVEITGNESLVAGDNAVKITVTAQDGTTRIYTINVKKGEATTLGLSSLKINGYTLSPKFSSNVYEYKINVLDPNITKLDVLATANVENAKVEVTGNTNLVKGENTITITVTSEDGKEKVIYQILVNKDSDVTATTNKKDMIIYGGIVVGVILIFVIIIIVVKSRKKKKQPTNNNNVDDYSDLYGYSSKNVTSVRNENQNDMQSNNQYKEINQLQENTNNESEINTYQNTDTTTQFNMDNEYKSTNEPENPYISKDMYADYSENSKQTYNNQNTYDGLYGSYSESNNKITTNDIQEQSLQQDNYLDNQTQEDYTIDDNYKFKRSKGKHSK